MDPARRQMTSFRIFHLLAVFLVSLPAIISTRGTQLIPDGFTCTRDMPRQRGIYSTPLNSNLIKVDLIHVFCGQIYSSSSSSSSCSGGNGVKVGGFHSRPGNTDPASASTANSKLIRTPPNAYGYAVYQYPYIYDSSCGRYVMKNTGTISSMWPTVLSMEEITEIITQLVYLCKPSQNRHLCVSDVTLVPWQSTTAELFDVAIIRGNSTVVRSAYPMATGTCDNKSTSYFDKCDFNSTMSMIVAKGPVEIVQLLKQFNQRIILC